MYRHGLGQIQHLSEGDPFFSRKNGITLLILLRGTVLLNQMIA